MEFDGVFGAGTVGAAAKTNFCADPSTEYICMWVILVTDKPERIAT